MTMETWKAEFYPKEANGITDSVEAVEHALTKWEGLTEANLKKHGLIKSECYKYSIEEEEDISTIFYINASTCSLCELFMVGQDCHGCPLYQHLGHRCDEETDPYNTFGDNNDPLPMIEALKGALVLVKQSPELYNQAAKDAKELNLQLDEMNIDKE